MSKSVLAIVLGGGRGTRLHPLTHKRSKPAVPLAGKYRLVDIPISNCLNSQMNKIYVLTQFNSASLNKHIKNSYSFDLFSKGFVDILAAEQTYDNSEWYQGTADAIRQSFHHFEEDNFEYMLILSGDQLYQMDYREMLEAHKKNNADVTIATIPVNAEDSTGFGIMKKDHENVIKSFIEKPDIETVKEWASDTGEEMQSQGRHYLASMGIYLFNREVIKHYMEATQGADFGKNIIPEAIQNHKVMSYQYEGYWTDIGTIKSFYEANLDLTKPIPKFNLFQNHHPIFTHARMLPPAKVQGTTLEGALISDGCIIRASRLENVVIGIRTRIGSATTISNSYLMGSDYFESLDEIEANKRNGIPALGVGERCFIQHAIIDKNVRIGNDVRLQGGTHLDPTETDNYVIADGIIVVKKGATIPDGFVL